MRALFAPLAVALVACSSSGGSGGAPPTDSGATSDDTAASGDATSAVDAGPAPYTVTLFDDARIGSDSTKPNFQKVAVDLPPLHDGPFAKVTLVLDLTSTCFPFDKWKTNKPPAGQNWPADCDAFDRNFETWLVDPAAPKDTPSIELVRAITPFGGPEHVEEDVTDLFAALDADKHPRSVEVHISTWSDGAGKVSGSNGGWNISAHLEVVPGAPARKVLAVLPLVNGSWDSKSTAKPVPFTLPAGTTSTRIEYRVTGHGGADGTATGCGAPADEFCRRKHHVTLDGAPLADVTPWRADCKTLCTVAHDPMFTNYCAQNPCGNLDSVRAQRANWCPGSETPPITWTPDALRAPGVHAFQYAIDGVADGGSWRVSAIAYAFGD